MEKLYKSTKRKNPTEKRYEDLFRKYMLYSKPEMIHIISDPVEEQEVIFPEILPSEYRLPEISLNSTQEERIRYAKTYLMNKGFSKEAASGIVGVFMAESGLLPRITNASEAANNEKTAGRGIGQWSNNRRQQYEAFMVGKSGLKDELDFFLQDLENRPLVKEALSKATTVDQAVDAMHLGYENGSTNKMATADDLTRTYTAAWQKLGIGNYDYNNARSKRIQFATAAFNLE